MRLATIVSMVGCVTSTSGFLTSIVALVVSGKVTGATPKALGVASCASEGLGVSPWDCTLGLAGLCACEDTVSAGGLGL